MKHKTTGEVLHETALMHDRARQDPTLSAQERNNLWIIVEQSYNWCLEQSPNEPVIVGALAAMCVDTGRTGAAIALFEYATKLDATEAQAWNGLGVAYRRAQKMPQARQAFKRAMQINPDNPDHYSNMAGTYINEGDSKPAIEWCDKGLKLNPNHKDCKFNRGIALLEQGDFARGWEGYEYARKWAGWRERIYQGPKGEIPQWNGEPGKTIIIYGEQGVGDECLFSTCIQDAIDISKHVIIDCHPRLYNLFKRSFPDATVYGTRKQDKIAWPGQHEIDARIAMGSLPTLFRQNREAFPASCAFVRPDPAQVEAHQGTSGKYRIGLTWIGGTKETRIEERSIQPAKLGTLLTIPNVEWVSLQYTDNAGEQVDAMRQMFKCDISHDNAMNADLDKLFGCIAGLDLTVNVLTSNIHFAGVMGKESFIMAPIKCPWQFALDDVPWYPQHKLYRQTKYGDWESVFTRIRADIETKRNAHYGKLPRAKSSAAREEGQLWGG